MASMQLHKSTDKSLSQGYYGGNKYQNSYEMSYTERERRCPPTTYSQSHTAYEYGKFHGAGGGHENGFGSSHMSNGFGQAQAAYGSNHNTSHGSGHHGNGHAQTYGSNHQTSHGSGHHGNGHSQAAYGSNHHTSSGKHHGSAGYGFGGCDGNNGLGNFTNHGMQHGGGNFSGHMMKPQAHGHHGGGNMGYGMSQGSESSEYSQVYYSNESHYNGGGRGHRTGRVGHAAGKVKGMLGKIKTGISGNNSCSDSDSDDSGYHRKTVVVSKAL